ncbi:hypothetical protein SCH4B_0453 [Ruegeria sp. TrichCH4B]|nr:hypothetical protein SCH4B_0453 [Ruegeria sp. TrichCH4B]
MHGHRATAAAAPRTNIATCAAPTRQGRRRAQGFARHL